MAILNRQGLVTWKILKYPNILYKHSLQIPFIKRLPSGIYHVADDESLSTNELIKLIAAASERKPLLWNISPALIRSIARLGDMFHLPLTTERLNKLTENYIVDNTKIKQALGKELPVRARDGILRTIRSFR